MWFTQNLNFNIVAMSAIVAHREVPSIHSLSLSLSLSLDLAYWSFLSSRYLIKISRIELTVIPTNLRLEQAEKLPHMNHRRLSRFCTQNAHRAKKTWVQNHAAPVKKTKRSSQVEGGGVGVEGVTSIWISDGDASPKILFYLYLELSHIHTVFFGFQIYLSCWKGKTGTRVKRELLTCNVWYQA